MIETNPLILKLRQSGQILEEDYEPLARLCTSARAVEANTVLVKQGERLKGVYLVLDGFAYRYKLLPRGQRQILGILLPGDFCDIQGAILGHSDHFTATLTDSAVVWVPREQVDELTLAPTRIARALWWAALVDECILRSWLANMGQQPADKWFVHFCCEMLLRLQVVGYAESHSCEMPFTQEKLADILGITNVHVNRVLKELREMNLLQFKDRRLTVPDVAKLRSHCDFDPSYLHLNGSPNKAPLT